MRNDKLFYQRYPPSTACSCGTCLSFCQRPGWWLVSEAREAIKNGYANRMMLEISFPDSLAILAPAFKGNEGFYATQEFSTRGCTFLEDGRCQLFQKSFRPIECRYCHHDRKGLGTKCHNEIANDWDSNKGRRLIRQWINIVNLTPDLL